MSSKNQYDMLLITDSDDPVKILTQQRWDRDHMFIRYIYPYFEQEYDFSYGKEHVYMGVDSCSFECPLDFLNIRAFFKHNSGDYTVVVDVLPHQRSIKSSYEIRFDTSEKQKFEDDEYYVTPITVPHCYLLLCGLKSSNYKIVLPYRNYFVGWSFGNSFLYDTIDSDAKRMSSVSQFNICRSDDTEDEELYNLKFPKEGDSLNFGNLAMFLYSDFFDSAFNKHITRAPMTVLTELPLEESNETLISKMYQIASMPEYQSLGKHLCVDIQTRQYKSFNQVYMETHSEDREDTV